jgi:hypothetical protein
MAAQNKREREEKKKTMTCEPVFAVKQCKTW